MQLLILQDVLIGTRAHTLGAVVDVEGEQVAKHLVEAKVARPATAEDMEKATKKSRAKKASDGAGD